MNEPALYSTVNNLQRQDTDDITDEFIDEICQIPGSFIDIGSGPSDVVHDLILPKLNTDATIVCSDISKDMVNFGKLKYKDKKRMTFIELDIETSDLSEDLVERFDHVTSFWCLHWCHDLRQVFENIFSLLRPGGTSLLTFIANLPLAKSYKNLAAMPRYQPYMKDVDRYIPIFQHAERPREALMALLNDVGFEVHHCSLREKSYIFDTPDALSKFMAAVNPFIDRIPTELREEYEEDLVREVARTNIVFNKNKNNEHDYSTLIIHGTFVVYLKKTCDQITSKRMIYCKSESCFQNILACSNQN